MVDRSKSVEINAERILRAIPARGGKPQTLRVSLDTVDRDESLDCYKCKISFSEPIMEIHEIAGVDAIDSLRLAIRFIDTRLTNARSEFEIRWDDDSPYQVEHED